MALRVAVAHPAAELPPGAAPEGEERARRKAIFDGDGVDTAVVAGPPADRVDGPAIVELPEATLVIPQGWSCRPTADGTLLVERG